MLTVPYSLLQIYPQLLQITNINLHYYLLDNKYVAAKKQESADSSDQPPGEAIIPTLPDVKMCAAKAIGRSARSGKCTCIFDIVIIFKSCKNLVNNAQ